MRIQHNIAAVNAHRQLGGNNSAVAKNLEKLSSGYRINKAGDDAAGLSISEKMRAQIKGLETAQKNAQDGVSLIQTAEGNLTEVHSMLNRMVELSTQSANGTYATLNREELQKEVVSLTSEIDRIASSANFNGIKLLDGSLGGGATGGSAGVPAIGGLELTDTAATKGVYTSAGAIANDITTGIDGGKMSMSINYTDANGKSQSANIELTVDAANKKLVAADGTTYNITDFDDIKKGEAQKAFMDQFKKSDLGKTFNVTMSANDEFVFTAKTGGTNSKINNIMLDLDPDATTTTETLDVTVAAPGADAYQSGKITADEVFTIDGKKFAIASSAAAGNALGNDVNVFVSASGAIDQAALDGMAAMVKQQTGYTPTTNGAADGFDFIPPTGAAAGGNGKGLVLQVGETSDAFQKVTVSVDNMNAASLGLGGINISSQDGASAAMDAINAAIDQVSSTRGDLGALQNRLDHTINNLGVTNENMTAAESRIRDVDMAKEMMDFTKNNILTQAAQAMLAQANTLPQGVLQLLK